MTPRGGVNIWVVHTLCQLSVALLFVPTLHCLPEWIKNICHVTACFGPSWQDHLPLLVYNYLLTLSSVIAFCEVKEQVVYTPVSAPVLSVQTAFVMHAVGPKGSASLIPFIPYNLPLSVQYVFILISKHLEYVVLHIIDLYIVIFNHPHKKLFLFIIWHVVGTL